MLKKFAEELRENRIKNDITLQQVAAKTRIDIKFLDAIEQGNFDILPDVYLKAFLKGYAGATGLDEVQTLKRYEAAKAGRNPDEAAGSMETPEPRKEIKPEKPRVDYTLNETVGEDNFDEPSSSSNSARNSLIILILGILLIALAAVAYFVFSPSSSEIVTEKPYEEIVEENRQRFEPPADTTSAAAAVPAASQQADDSLTLSIKTADESYIKVTSDSVKTVEFNLQANGERRLKAKNGFRVVIGNATSIQMALNEKPLNFVTGRGEVVVVRVDAGGIQYVRPPKTLQKNE